MASEHRGHFENGRIHFSDINVLPQPRKTFEEIDSLGDGIAATGLIHWPLIARYTEKECQDHLFMINEVWGTNIEFRSLHPVVEGGESVYYILIAGERRVRAHRYIWEKGCSACREERGEEEPGTCFRRHFGADGKFEVRFAIGVAVLRLLELQLAENTHIAVPPHEEAHAYARLYRWDRLSDKKSSLAKFARRVNRSEGTIRQALWYCGLPSKIQDVVERGEIPYGIGVQLARLQQNDFDEEHLLRELVYAVAARLKVAEFRERVTASIRDLHSPQMSLAGMMSREQEMETGRGAIRSAVQRHTLQGIWAYLHYFRVVQSLFNAGLLGKKDSPYSHKSTLRIFRRYLELLNELRPHLSGLLPKRVGEEAGRVIPEIQEEAGRLEEALDSERF